MLEPNFAPAELVPLDELAGLYATGTDQAFAAVALDGDQPVGALLADLFPASGVLLLSYLAVRADARGRGVGSALIRALVPSWQTRPGVRLILGEVEDPRFHSVSRFGDPVARLRLYGRLGAGLLAVPYVQPRVRAGEPRVRDMLLITFGEGERVPAAAPLRFLEEYFAGCEGPDVVDDAEYRALLATVERHGTHIPVLAPSAFAEVSRLSVREELLLRDYPATATVTELLAKDPGSGLGVLDGSGSGCWRGWRRPGRRRGRGWRCSRN